MRLRLLPCAATLVGLGALAPFLVAAKLGPDGTVAPRPDRVLASAHAATPAEEPYDLSASEACLGRRIGLKVYRILPGEVASYVFDTRTEGGLMVISPPTDTRGTIGVALLFQLTDADAADRVTREHRPDFERQGRVVLAWGNVPPSGLRQTVLGCLRGSARATA